MRIHRFVTRLLASVLMASPPALVLAMGSADHDLARDMANGVYRVPYDKPRSAPCAAGAGTEERECDALRPGNPGPAGKDAGCAPSHDRDAAGCPPGEPGRRP